MRGASHLSFPVIILGLAAGSMLLPAGHAAVAGQYEIGRAFLYSAVILAALVTLIALTTAGRRARLSPRDHLSVLIGTYAVLPLALALPMLQAIPGLSIWHAWFEMLAAFTTTGATLFAPEVLPDTLHLWRALIAWLGGFHMVVMALAVLAPMNLVGIEVSGGSSTRTGSAGAPQISRIADTGQRIRYFALMLFPAYGGLTLLLWVGLLMAGDSGLVALCHAMSTLSTSGISPIGGTDQAPSGVVGEALIAVFLLVAISRRILPTMAGLEPRVWRYDPEMRTAAVIVLVAVAAFFVTHGLGAAEAMRLDVIFHLVWGAFFTALSFLTTTGFVSTSWRVTEAWSGLQTPGLMMLALALVGGGIATSAGGVKLLRVYALYRHGQRELERLIEPSSVGGRGSAARQLRNEGAFLAFIFFVLFAILIGGVTASLTVLSMELEPALVLAIAALTNTGPVAESFGTGLSVWAGLTVAQQAVLAVGMVLGRLEMLAVLAFLAPDSWRR